MESSLAAPGCLLFHDEAGRVTCEKVLGQDSVTPYKLQGAQHSCRNNYLKECVSGRAALLVVPSSGRSSNLSYPNPCQSFYSADPYNRSSQYVWGFETHTSIQRKKAPRDCSRE